MSRATNGALRRRGRLLRLLLVTLVVSVALSGCDFDVYRLPLPGGADVGDRPIEVTVMFGDVLDLVPKSSVKVDEVNVGQVTAVDLDGYTARVRLELRRDVELPDNALAEIRQTSLLGEKFVSLSAPPTGASIDPLSSGDVIPLERSGRNPEVEEVLGALSLVLNGGGVAQLRTIARELNLALGGREDAARSVLTQIDTLTANLDDNKADIVAAIEALNRLSIAASKQIPTIDAGLAELPSALESIDSQRAALVQTLQALDDLSGVGVGVIEQSKDNTVTALQQLQPVLTKLADSGASFVNAFNTFYAYPFVDEVVGRDPQVARNLHIGDYTNLDIQAEVDLTGILPTLPTALPTALPTNLPKDILDAVEQCLASGDPLSEACRSLIGNGLLKEQCKQPPLKGTLVCTLPGPPSVPGPSGGPSLPGIPPPSGGATTAPPPVLPSLPIIGGVLRAAPWAAPNAAGTGGPTVAQLQQVYDPDLVALMVPGMTAGPIVVPTAARSPE